jgi:hypothetical protein
MSNTPSFLTSLSAQEEAELLNSFGKGLSSSPSSPENNSSTNSAWPNAPSPLPTISRTAAELAGSSIQRKQPPQDEEGLKEDGGSSLEKVMKESQGRKRMINPMTHG